MITASVRLWMASSMNVAGRKIFVSMLTPGSPGRRSLIACSTPFVTATVLDPGNFSITIRRPGPPFTTASPMSGGWP